MVSIELKMELKIKLYCYMKFFCYQLKLWTKMYLRAIQYLGCKVKSNEDRNKRTSADVSNTSTTSKCE